MRKIAPLLIALAGCGNGTQSNSMWVAGFSPPDAPAGYTRFVTPTVMQIPPGSDIEYCQWIAAPAGMDQDVLDLQGYESPGSHHVVLYSTSETKFPVGETHVCTEQDMLSIAFVGAMGGEGTGGQAARLPDGLYFRLPGTRALMANTHWVNATGHAVDAQAVIDVKFDAASNTRTTADLFANNGDTFSLPPSQMTAYDNSCVLGADLNVAMIANHMHQKGTSAFTELIHADGSKQMLVQDTTWASDQQFNPKYVRFGLQTPLAAKKGDTLHTHCEWMNSTAQTVGFPAEMCTAAAFYFPSQGQLVCNDGHWGG